MLLDRIRSEARYAHNHGVSKPIYIMSDGMVEELKKEMSEIGLQHPCFKETKEKLPGQLCEIDGVAVIVDYRAYVGGDENA